MRPQPMRSVAEISALILQARAAGDWTAHADLWEQRRFAEVTADESRFADAESVAYRKMHGGEGW